MNYFAFLSCALSVLGQAGLEPGMPFTWIDPMGRLIVFNVESFSFERAGVAIAVERCPGPRCLDGGSFVILLPSHDGDAEIVIGDRAVRSECGAFRPIGLLGRKFNARWCQTYLQGELVASMLHDDTAGIIMLAFWDGEEWVSGIVADLPGLWGTVKFDQNLRPAQ